MTTKTPINSTKLYVTENHGKVGKSSRALGGGSVTCPTMQEMKAMIQASFQIVLAQDGEGGLKRRAST